MKFNLKDINFAAVLVTVLLSAIVLVIALKVTRYKNELTGESFKAELALGSKDTYSTEE